MQEIIKLGSITFVLSSVAKVGGRKEDSKYILLTGLCKVALPFLKLVIPSVNNVVTALGSLSAIADTILSNDVLNFIFNLFK